MMRDFCMLCVCVKAMVLKEGREKGFLIGV